MSATSALLISLVPAVAFAAGSATIQWHGQMLVSVSVTPNYATGYGAILSKFGGGAQMPVSGPGAPAAVDFGSVLAGDSYLYKFAAHVKVSTNDPGGFNLYGEGTADFIAVTSGGNAPLSSTLFYVNSVAGGTDTNNGFNAPAYPFSKTSGAVTGGSPPSINYGGSYPNPIAASNTPLADFYEDYLLKTPATAVSSSYAIWVVYTVVPQ
ncbi:MAG: hypothetical protein M3R51_01440 [Candidatus Eremiobacteraeota bacterium]|nr:hypothetical protein [Candidatus Eremiobacteraeota bacterium]